MSFPAFFKEGLYRVAKVAQSNPNYKDIIGDRIGNFFAVYSSYELGEQLSPDEALSVLDRVLYDKRMVKFMLPPRAAVAFGKTKNNLREFEFFRTLLSNHGLDHRVFNAGWVPPGVMSIKVKDLGPVLGYVRNCFVEYSGELRVLPKSVVLQLINYVLAYFSWQWNFAIDRRLMPKVVIVANDHSPAQVACSMAAKEQGIPRIYIQHAEVSEAFPPLDFDMSLLRNAVSRAVYEKIGPVKGDIHIIGREKGSFNPAGFESAIREPCEVGVYLTAQTDWEGVRMALARLLSNEYVSTVFVKPHPAMAIQKVQQECPPDIDVQGGTPDRPHVAVVANSSVVIELLHRGIPVFQYYGMDSIPDDYYGFSRQGVAKKLELTDLESNFWKTFNPDEAWLSVYARYNPMVGGDSQSAESKLVRDLKRYFSPAGDREHGFSFAAGVQSPSAEAIEISESGGNNLPEFWPQRFALTKLPNTTFDVINRRSRANVGSPPIDKDLFVKAFESLFNDRSPQVYDLFTRTAEMEVESGLVHWIKRRDIEWTGRKVSDAELDMLLEFAVSGERDPGTRKLLEVLMLMLLIRLNDKARVKYLLSKAEAISFKQMHINYRIAALKWFREQLPIEFPVQTILAELCEGLSSFHWLKLKVVSATESLFESGPWNHRDIEDQFLATAPEGLQRDFIEIVRPCYDRHRWHMKFMDVRWSKSQRCELLIKIKTALAEREPFSLIRLGDGEGYIFGCNHRFFTEEDMGNRERHWWGLELPGAMREEIQGLMRSAAENADVLGIPSVYRFLRDNTDSYSTLLHNIQGRGLIEVVSGVSRFSNKGKLFSEEGCNLTLFGNLQSVQELALEATRVLVIASAAPSLIRGLFRDDKDLLYITIPTHSRTISNEKYASFQEPLPYVYKDIRKEITATVRPGDLVLIAAGVIGKVFMDDARNAGGVALDVGGSLDNWIKAGIHSLH